MSAVSPVSTVRTSVRPHFGPSGTHHCIGQASALVAKSIAGPFEITAGGRRLVCWNASIGNGIFAALFVALFSPMTSVKSLSFMDNTCVHRAAPLSKGWLDVVEGKQTIRCPYHALAFAPDGRVIHIPSQSNVPCGRIQRTYAAVHIGKFVYLTDRAENSEAPTKAI